MNAPKVYVRDSGLLHELLGVESPTDLLHHPKLGASWEGFAIEQVLATEPHADAAYWATHQGAEIDLLLRRRGKLYGVECKRMDAPRMTPSIRNALADLALERLGSVVTALRRPRRDAVHAAIGEKPDTVDVEYFAPEPARPYERT